MLAKALRSSGARALVGGGRHGAAAASATGQGADKQEFNRTADQTLGDLWNRLERGLREAEGEARVWGGGRRSRASAAPPPHSRLPAPPSPSVVCHRGAVQARGAARRPAGWRVADAAVGGRARRGGSCVPPARPPCAHARTPLPWGHVVLWLAWPVAHLLAVPPSPHPHAHSKDPGQHAMLVENNLVRVCVGVWGGSHRCARACSVAMLTACVGPRSSRPGRTRGPWSSSERKGLGWGARKSAQRRSRTPPPLRRLDGSSGDFNSQEGEGLEAFIQAGLRARLGTRVNLGQPVGEDGG